MGTQEPVNPPTAPAPAALPSPKPPPSSLRSSGPRALITIPIPPIACFPSSAALCTTVHSYAGVSGPTEGLRRLPLHIHCTTPLYTACATLLLKPQLKKGN